MADIRTLFPEWENLFSPGGAFQTEEGIKAKGLKRLGGLAIRGATFGFKGARTPPENLTESAVEFIGSVPSIGGISAIDSPATAATLRTVGVGARFLPIASRLTAASATGAISGGAEAASEGHSIPKGAAISAAEFAVAEGAFMGGSKLYSKLRGAPHEIKPETSLGTKLIPDEMVGKAVADTMTGEPPGKKPPLLVKLEKLQAGGKKEIPEGEKELPKSVKKTDEFEASETRKTLTQEGQAEQNSETDPRAKVIPKDKDLVAAARQKGEYQVVLGETGLKEIIDTAPEKGLSQSLLFNATIDKATGKVVYTPVSEAIGNAVAVAENLPPKIPHQDWLPGISEDAKRKLASTDTNREPFLTSNAMKNEAIAQKLMEDGESPLKISELKTIEFSPEDLEMRTLLKKEGIQPDTIDQFMASIPPGTPEQRYVRIRQFLREKCGK